MRSALTAMVLLVTQPALAQDAPVVVKPVVVDTIFSGGQTAAGQPIVLPQGPVQVAFSTYAIAAGAKLPVHRHPFPRYAYVLDGEITVTDVENGAQTTYKKGEVILEMIDRWHFGENRGSETMHLLVIDQAAADAATTVLKPN